MQSLNKVSFKRSPPYISHVVPETIVSCYNMWQEVNFLFNFKLSSRQQ